MHKPIYSNWKIRNKGKNVITRLNFLLYPIYSPTRVAKLKRRQTKHNFAKTFVEYRKRSIDEQKLYKKQLEFIDAVNWKLFSSNIIDKKP